MRPVGRGESPSVPFSFGRRSTTYHVDPQPSHPRSFSLTSHFLARRWRFPSLLHLPVFVLLLIPECFWNLLIGKHKSYAREERQSRINKSLKRPPGPLDFFIMLYFSQDTNVFSRQICKLFFNLHLNSLFFNFARDELYLLVSFYSYFFHVFISRSIFIFSLSLLLLLIIPARSESYIDRFE